MNAIFLLCKHYAINYYATNVKSWPVHLNEFSSIISITIRELLTKSKSAQQELQKGVSNYLYHIPFSHKSVISVNILTT